MITIITTILNLVLPLLTKVVGIVLRNSETKRETKIRILALIQDLYTTSNSLYDIRRKTITYIDELFEEEHDSHKHP